MKYNYLLIYIFIIFLLVGCNNSVHTVQKKEALEATAKEWEHITETYGRENQKVYYQKWKDKHNGR